MAEVLPEPPRSLPSVPSGGSFARETGWLFLFALTMGIFEAAVVVYLNRLQMLGELSFARDRGIAALLLKTEVLREAASLAMIASVAALTARGFVSWLARAALIFGVWDIIYYVFLKILIGFPASPLTWDVLFLIPTAWLGPVLAPVLVSLALIGGGLLFLRRERDGRPLRPAAWHWLLAVAGGAVVILSFILDTPADFDGLHYPARFRWEVFLTGLVASLLALAAAARRHDTTVLQVEASIPREASRI